MSHHFTRIIDSDYKRGCISARPFEAAYHISDATRRCVCVLHTTRPHLNTIAIEVESLINAAVAEVVTDDDSLSPHRELLTDRLVEALSKSADWIELYGVTGELVVPDNLSEDGKLATAFARLKEVRLIRRTVEPVPLTCLPRF